MKYLFLIALSVGFSHLVNAADLGKQIRVYKDNVGPQLGVQYAYDSDKFLAMTFTVWGADLSPTSTIKTIAWRLFDSGSGSWINAWSTAVNNPSSIMYTGAAPFSLSLARENEVLIAIKSLTKLKIVLSVDGDLAAPMATHFVDLGGYCISDAGHFMNLTSGKKGCR